MDSYSLVASEYYDNILHPTCANFGFTSLSLLNTILSDGRNYGSICEVGSGLSSVLSLRDKIIYTNAFITDVSQEMLFHSKERFSVNDAYYVISDATRMSFGSESFDTLVSSLGDPYNSVQFWDEAQRILRKDGTVLFTTPSWQWASSFRLASREEQTGSAFFMTRDGQKIYLRSDIRTEPEQSDLIQEAGFDLIGIQSYTFKELKLEKSCISAKLESYLSDNTPVVTMYHARKRSSQS